MGETGRIFHTPCLIASTMIAITLWSPLPGQTALLESGSFATGDGPLSSQLRVVSYNVHGPFTDRFEAVATALEGHPNLSDAALFALQEVNRNRAESGQRDVARDLARRLGMHYLYAVELQYEDGDGERGLALLSPYPMSDPVRIVLPVEGPRGRRRIALGATIHLGTMAVRIYNLHLETRISSNKRRSQVEAILQQAEQFSHLPTIILGDFNTFPPGSRKMMFEVMENAGFSCPMRADKPTFHVKLFLRLKLDWIWLRGITPTEADVEGQVKASDHRPLWVTFPKTSGH